MPRLLNYLTSPNVVLWSAVCASCALQMLFDEVVILAKDSSGTLRPWNPPGNCVWMMCVTTMCCAVCLFLWSFFFFFLNYCELAFNVWFTMRYVVRIFPLYLYPRMRRVLPSCKHHQASSGATALWQAICP